VAQRYLRVIGVLNGILVDVSVMAKLLVYDRQQLASLNRSS
jgi:hypothetical protein